LERRSSKKNWQNIRSQDFSGKMRAESSLFFGQRLKKISAFGMFGCVLSDHRREKRISGGPDNMVFLGMDIQGVAVRNAYHPMSLVVDVPVLLRQRW
jgi:hypothetical protein